MKYLCQFGFEKNYREFFRRQICDWEELYFYGGGGFIYKRLGEMLRMFFKVFLYVLVLFY